MDRTTTPPAEQQARYNALEEATSTHLAYFYCCIAYDVPFDPDAVPREETKNKWVEYLKALAQMPEHLDQKGKYLSFLDGQTDIMEVFGDTLDMGAFRSALEVDKPPRPKLPGTAKQRELWGRGPTKNPYTSDDYDEMDRTYKIISSDLERAGRVSSKQEFILRRCARRTLEMDRAEMMGAYEKVTKISKLIQTDLESEQLRKKDAKPVENFQLDSWADFLEKAGLTKNGKRCEPDEMFEILFGRLPQYPYTKDAAEQLILINENRMRNNDGQGELSILPDEMRLHDSLGEFAREQSEGELEAYEKLGLVKLPPPGAEHGAKQAEEQEVSDDGAAERKGTY